MSKFEDNQAQRGEGMSSAIDEVMVVIIKAGAIMLQSGAETYRVEDTVVRLGLALGMARVEPFAMPTGLIVTLEDRNGFTRTEVYRIVKRETNLHKVIMINDLSRQVAQGQLDYNQIVERIKEVGSSGDLYPRYLYWLAAGVGSGAFSVLFEANLLEFCVATVAGWVVHSALALFRKKSLNQFIIAFSGGAISACMAVLGQWVFPQINFDRVLTGAIMTLVPGVAITNAIRDVINEDLISGGSRGLDAFLTAMAVAGGAAIVMGMIVVR